MDKVQFKWYDSEYHDGECADEKGKIPTTGKKLLSYRTNQLLCFYDCQKERLQPRWKKEPNLRVLKLPYIRGCEFDSMNNKCYSHTSKTLTNGNNKPNFKCMLFLTLAQEPGKCVPYGSQPQVSPQENRIEFPDLTEPRDCLKACLREYNANYEVQDIVVEVRNEEIFGCEFSRKNALESTCAGITNKFEGGSRLPDPKDGLNICWKIQEHLPSP